MSSRTTTNDQQQQQLQRGLAAQRLMTEYCQLNDQAEANRDRIEAILEALKRHKLLSPMSIQVLRRRAFTPDEAPAHQRGTIVTPMQFFHRRGDPYETFVDNLDGLIDNMIRLFHVYEGFLAQGANPAVKPRLFLVVKWDLPRGVNGNTASGVDHSAVNIEWDRLAEWAMPVSKLTRDEKDIQRTFAAMNLFRIFCNLQQGKLPVATRAIYDSPLDGFRDYQLLSEKSIGVLDQMSRRTLNMKGV